MNLITGSAGYIGTHLRKLLPAWESCDLKYGKDYQHISGREFDVVIHLAAFVSVLESFENPEKYFRNNALGVGNFLANNHVNRFVFMSTGGAMYGNARAAREGQASWYTCDSPYAKSKLAAEYLIAGLHNDAVVLRLANVFGGDYTMRGEAAVHSHFEHDDPIVVYGGDQTRDFVHIDTVCAAIYRAIIAPAGTYNIGSERETSIKTIADDYGQSRGVRVEVRPKRTGETDFISLDCSRAKTAGLLEVL